MTIHFRVVSQLVTVPKVKLMSEVRSSYKVKFRFLRNLLKFGGKVLYFFTQIL